MKSRTDFPDSGKDPSYNQWLMNPPQLSKNSGTLFKSISEDLEAEAEAVS